MPSPVRGDCASRTTTSRRSARRRGRRLLVVGMLKPLGIEKGRESNPDTRQRKILEEAAQMGDAMGRLMLFEGPDRFRQVGEGLGVEPLPGTKWHWVFQVNAIDRTPALGV